jgi:plasmid stability protein
MEAVMGDLLIRNIPDALKIEITNLAERAGRSLSDEAKELLRKGLLAEEARSGARHLSAWDRLRPVLADGFRQTDEEFARLMDEIEAERKNDFGRPVGGFE